MNLLTIFPVQSHPIIFGKALIGAMKLSCLCGRI